MIAPIDPVAVKRFQVAGVATRTVRQQSKWNGNATCFPERVEPAERTIAMLECTNGYDDTGEGGLGFYARLLWGNVD